ncbi:MULTISPECIES: hypothetical protein [Halomonadaceae]|uniref:Lipoprotein n=1 Tax=Modicisalibacter zincidurans TaxID=1178777 RepID=A0ABP9RIH7_9GAMM|nr:MULTISPECIES: hypothetical protein [Halomonas]MCD6006791.1 hypothetical protein [Halomonas sp. IOP_31]
MRQWMPTTVILLAGLFVAGCSYTPARIDPEPIVEVGDGHQDREGDRDHDHRDGGFCPPGQAKKGNC